MEITRHRVQKQAFVFIRRAVNGRIDVNKLVRSYGVGHG